MVDIETGRGDRMFSFVVCHFGEFCKELPWCWSIGVAAGVSGKFAKNVSCGLPGIRVLLTSLNLLRWGIWS